MRLALLLLLALQSLFAQRVDRVDSAGMTVSDADRAVRFFTTVLDFEKISDVELDGAAYERLEGVFGLRIRVVRLKLGDEFLDLTEYLAPKGRPVPIDSRSNDRWFQHVAIIVSDMDKAYARLRANKVLHASSGPQRLPDWNPNAGGIRAFYFKDPDQHVLEVLEFPAGKGNVKWQRKDRLFLGIDHTAIVVADTDASLRFYRDRLGLKIAGESENYGTEQEHLNNVFGARLRITALRAPEGIGIELLDYRAPNDGRPYPPDLRPNDLAFWKTRLITREIPNEAIALPDDSKNLLIRDPDGHAMHLFTPAPQRSGARHSLARDRLAFHLQSRDGKEASARRPTASTSRAVPAPAAPTPAAHPAPPHAARAHPAPPHAALGRTPAHNSPAPPAPLRAELACGEPLHPAPLYASPARALNSRTRDQLGPAIVQQPTTGDLQ
jgi:catechol 2,3-dioxygenase-like lactoylglutathione lyase family enzyme